MSTLKISYLRLVKNRRLLSKGTMEVVYTPESNMQLILGSNGYGKSTLAEEFSFLPGIPKNYRKGGLKHVIGEFNESKYELISNFESSPYHSFIKDGVELNDGHTFTVQKMLVEQHFNYTAEVHALLLGKLKFTRMTAAQRKDWLVRLSPNDVSYAVNLYKDLLVQARNVAGASKHNAAKIVETTAALLPPEVVESLQEQSQALIATIQQLHNLKTNSPVDPSTEVTISNFKGSAETLRKTLVAQKAMVREKYNPALELELEAITIAHAKASQALASELKEYERCEEILSNIVYSDGRTNQEIEEETETFRRFLKCGYDRKGFIKPKLPVQGEKTLLAIMGGFLDNLSDVTPNPDKMLFNPEKEKGNRLAAHQLGIEIAKNENFLLRAHSKLDELNNAIKVNCGKCGHEWLLNHDETERARVEAFIKGTTELVENQKLELVDIEAYLGDCSKWNRQFEYLLGLERNFPELDFFIDYVLTSGMFFNTPEQLRYILPKCVSYVQKRVEELELEEKIKLNNSILERRRSEEQSNTVSVRTRLQELEKEIEQGHLQVDTLAKQKLQVEDTLRNYRTLKITYQSTLSAMSTFMEASKKKLLTDLDVMLTAELDMLYGQLAKLNETISDVKSKEAILKHLTASKVELEEDNEIYKMLIEHISPSSGLIADVLLGFIKTLTAQLNDLIRKVWTTPLFIMPCGMDSTDLNYKFPLQSKDNQNGSADVSEASEGELELIDFVFMMVARHYLGYGKYPLFLDEVGRCFHETHRANLYNYIKLLLEAGLVIQVLVISHFESTYKTLTHADVNVMDPTGVLVTPGANKCLQIK